MIRHQNPLNRALRDNLAAHLAHTAAAAAGDITAAERHAADRARALADIARAFPPYDRGRTVVGAYTADGSRCLVRWRGDAVIATADDGGAIYTTPTRADDDGPGVRFEAYDHPSGALLAAGTVCPTSRTPLRLEAPCTV